MNTQLTRIVETVIPSRIISLSLLILAGQLNAQVVTNRVSTVPTGAVFFVDGTAYTSPQVFLWQSGTKHVLQINPQSDAALSTRYATEGWTDSTGTFSAPSSSVTVTANSIVTDYKAAVTVQHRITLSLFNYSTEGGRSTNLCAYPGSPNLPVSNNPGVVFPGIVYVGGICYDTSQTIWVNAASNLALAAYPFPGFVFQGWSVNTIAPDAFVGTILVNGPLVLNPRFAPGKRVTFYTDPPELQVRVDGTAVIKSTFPISCRYLSKDAVSRFVTCLVILSCLIYLFPLL